MKNFILAMTLVPVLAMAQEGGILVPVSLESSKLLPKGVRNVQFLDSRMDVINKFGDNRSTIPVGNALNKDVTWKESIKGKDDPYERAKLKGLLAENKISEDETLGQVTGEVNAAVEAQVPVIAYGVTNNWTMALVVPYVTTDVSIDTGFKTNKHLNSFTQKKLQDALSSEHKANKVKYDTLNAIDIKLKTYGYKSLSESEGRRTRLGDIRLISKNLVHEFDAYRGVVKSELTLPTGEATDPDKAVDLPSGDGQWDVGLAYTAEYDFGPAWSIVGTAGYTVQLETTTTKRIPEERDSKVSRDKETLTQDLGDRLLAQAAVNYNFLGGFTFSNAYTYQSKQKDQYTGDKYANKRYRWLEQETAQEMHAYTAAFGYSTIELFRAKKFPAPIQAGVLYTNVFEGRNVVKDEVVAMQLSLFF